MGKTRRTGDLVTDNNIYVNPTDDSFHVGAGITMYGGSVGIVSATAFYGEGSNISGVLSNVVEDNTPQLGGNLDLNSNNITGTGDIDITGSVEVGTGITMNTSGIDVVGVITATSFKGDGSQLDGQFTTGKAIAMAMVFG
jgi:hypothetical protein